MQQMKMAHEHGRGPIFFKTPFGSELRLHIVICFLRKEILRDKFRQCVFENIVMPVVGAN